MGLRKTPLVFALATLLGMAVNGTAQPTGTHRQFPPGSVNRSADLPAGRLRTQVDRLPPKARERAIEWLRAFHFTEHDLNSMQADQDGGIYYSDEFDLPLIEAADTPVTAEAAVPVNPLPADLLFHSRPGAPNVIFLNFCGESVSNTAWNTSLSRTSIPAVAFSTDSDFSTFSDSEQTTIKRIWQRVSEDYAPFNVDVTTERPSTFNNRTAHALITRNTDANGQSNPSSTAGGVAYINVFAGSGFANYRPAWIYYNNLSSSEANVAEAVSHELGHNMGLSHDGTSTKEYYGGHGSGDTSWGPLMGTGYSRNVSQWSKGEYYDADNTQDDLAVISGKLSYRTDDHGDAITNATALVITGTNVSATTPENDPARTNAANKGVLEKNTDTDVFSFTTGSGTVKLVIRPWVMSANTRGGNLDVLAELRDSAGVLLATNNSGTNTIATVQTNVAQGTYYLCVKNSGTGSPTNSSPTGYTSYGSIGQYFITGFVATASQPPPANYSLGVTANQPTWGGVNPTGGTYTAGTSVTVTATPGQYHRFTGWTGTYTGTNNPLTVVMNTNLSLQAIFAERMTTNHAVPYPWLAGYGYTNNLETAVVATGRNGYPVWQSYLAGLNPTNTTSQLRLTQTRGTNPLSAILRWNTVTGRVYTIYLSTNVLSNYVAITGASNLSSTVQSMTNTAPAGTPRRFFRIGVQKL